MLRRWLNNRIYITLVHKFSLLFSLLYVVIFHYNIGFTLLLKHLSVSLILCIGIAGIGYLFNDYNDMEQDKLANKQNIFLQFSKREIYLITILCLLFSIFPWFILPFNSVSLVLVGIEFFLFYAYAFKPFRWKEKGWLGVVADAGYAHVIPSVLAIYTFSNISNEEASFRFPIKVCFVFLIWLVTNGIRNILLHQIEDFEHDKKVSTKTWIQGIGIENVKAYIIRFMVPVEWICFLMLPIVLGNMYLWLLVPYLIYLILYFLKKWAINRYPFFKSSATTNQQLFLFFNGNMMNEYYEKYLPIVLLLLFCHYDSHFWIVLGFHFLVFFPIYLNKSI